MANISKKANIISTKIAELEKGKLDEKGLTKLINTCNELVEKLYILRFKAYEEKVLDEKTSKPKESIEPELPSFSLDLNSKESYENQVSLIDAIEEASKEKIEPQLKSDDKKEQTKDSFDLEISLNERLKSTNEAPSLGEKLQQSAIADLKAAIGINQKFLFINELFNEDTDEYLSAVERLNSCDSSQEAQHILQQELAPKYEWNPEKKVVKEFCSLVDRRYA